MHLHKAVSEAEELETDTTSINCGFPGRGFTHSATMPIPTILFKAIYQKSGKARGISKMV